MASFGTSDMTFIKIPMMDVGNHVIGLTYTALSFLPYKSPVLVHISFSLYIFGQEPPKKICFGVTLVHSCFHKVSIVLSIKASHSYVSTASKNLHTSAHTNPLVRTFPFSLLSVLLPSCQTMPTVQVPKTVYSRYGGWIPTSRVVHKSFLQKNAQLARSPLSTRATHIPAVAAFAQAIRADKEMADLFDQIFLQQVQEDATVITLPIIRHCRK
jgi:hypothetical protein